MKDGPPSVGLFCTAHFTPSPVRARCPHRPPLPKSRCHTNRVGRMTLEGPPEGDWVGLARACAGIGWAWPAGRVGGEGGTRHSTETPAPPRGLPCRRSVQPIGGAVLPHAAHTPTPLLYAAPAVGVSRWGCGPAADASRGHWPGYTRHTPATGGRPTVLFLPPRPSPPCHPAYSAAVASVPATATHPGPPVCQARVAARRGWVAGGVAGGVRARRVGLACARRTIGGHTAARGVARAWSR